MHAMASPPFFWYSYRRVPSIDISILIFIPGYLLSFNAGGLTPG